MFYRLLLPVLGSLVLTVSASAYQRPLYWDLYVQAPNAPATVLLVRRHVGTAPEVEVCRVAPTVTTCTDATAPDTDTPFYRAYACNTDRNGAEQCSPPSNEVSDPLIPIPAGMRTLRFFP